MTIVLDTYFWYCRESKESKPVKPNVVTVRSSRLIPGIWTSDFVGK